LPCCLTAAEPGSSPSRLRRLFGPVSADAVCLALLALLLLAFFAPAVVGGETFFFRDLSFNHVPRKLTTLAVLREGRCRCGTPS